MDRVLLVDGSNLLHRVCHIPSLVELTTRHGEQVGGGFGFLKSLRKALDTGSFNHCCIVWDAGLSERRKDLFPEYKANRRRTPPAEGEEQGFDYMAFFHHQRHALELLLPPLGVKQVWIKGREADDLVYWARLLYREHLGEKTTFLVSSEDKDFFQLVSPDTDVYRPIRDEYVTLPTFETLVGIPHKCFLLHKSIVGDAGDGIPGIQGVGPKAADTAARGIHVEESYEMDVTWSWEELKWFCETHKLSRVRKIADAIDVVQRNFELVSLSREHLTGEEKEEFGRLVASNVEKDFSQAVKGFMEYEYETILKDLASWMIPFKGLS